jgi:hypothetical protein
MGAAEQRIADLALGGAGHGWCCCLRTVAGDEMAERDTRETDGTAVATAASQVARWRRREVARLRRVLGLGLVTGIVHAAAEAVPGRLRSLLGVVIAAGAHAPGGGAVHLLPADISRPARLWTRQFPDEGAGRLTEPPPDTWMNSEPAGTDGIEGVPLERVTPACRGLRGG